MKKVSTDLAKKNINQLLTIVNRSHDTIEVENPNTHDAAVMVSMKDWLKLVASLANPNSQERDILI